ncbi:hypothetical protein Pse7367_3256 [Thalassoporum mexicanum PCC 7367]|uniref:DUF429 domain-containing protein n=1 Tax=Thalassoporum mexicanum TaxID=3457544 RepID=UPI00029FC6E2|nr:DUF429 domain-containing protein [Pseudanabaena sp. PCC 7367]AFY71499.1 hypothetical protein Pse7367_3256 [Pseudanabaena sp. PCC 7367]
MRQYFYSDPLRILGVDFTSSPRVAKPIVVSNCQLKNAQLTYLGMDEYTDWQGFEAFLAQSGAWVVGMDFPMGMPRRLIEALGWGKNWQEYVQLVAGMSRDEFVATLDQYRLNQPMGDKEHRRYADVLAGAISPMKLYVVPVGKMFYEGVKRLWRSQIYIPPFYFDWVDQAFEISGTKAIEQRVALETYPALAVRRWLGRTSYKNDNKRKQTEAMRSAREEVMRRLRSPDLVDIYGVSLVIEDQAAAEIVSDGSGDQLDALICAIQAAWAVGQPNYGIPENCDRLEGWIVDPSMLRK